MKVEKEIRMCSAQFPTLLLLPVTLVFASYLIYLEVGEAWVTVALFLIIKRSAHFIILRGLSL